jgi:DNA recombination protein RmuC
MTLILIIMGAAIVLLTILLFTRQNAGSGELHSLRDQLTDMKLKQAESQGQFLLTQQRMFQESQSQVIGHLTSLTNSVNDNLSKNQNNIQGQLMSANSMMGEVQKKLGILETTANEMRDLGKDISSLQNILQAPKLRGNLGEYLLEDLLKQIFPAKHYEMKFSFRNGTQVDAILRLSGGIVPVDSKFPLESFRRLVDSQSDEDKKAAKREFIKSVKVRIDEIATKYINPGEGTFDFALMYIPAENVFYEVIVNDTLTEKDYELFNYAVTRHVIPVSPNSFYAYLMAIVYGLKGFRIEQQARTIVGELSSIQSSFLSFYRELGTLGKHLNAATGKYEESLKNADKLGHRLTRVTGISTDLTEAEGPDGLSRLEDGSDKGKKGQDK